MNTGTLSTSITREVLDTAYTYRRYTDLVVKLFSEGRTTNENNTDSYLGYTELNIRRSSRWDKRARINEDLREALANFPKKMTWLVLSEGWCGDAAQILPFLAKMADLSPNIELKIILRDEHPEIMDEFLTDGVSRSIPKLIALDSETLEVLGSWGPRPMVIQQEYLKKLRDPDYPDEQAKKDLHLWYARDKGEALEAEFLGLLHDWS